jgi:glycosyltransferase involved in cell wall biosynthesis
VVFAYVSNVVSKVDVNEIRNMDLTNVLYISYDGMTDPLGQSQVLPYLSGLSKKGFKFHLISFEKEEKYKIHREHIQAICDRDGIVWHPLKYTKKPPLLSTLYDVIRMKQLAKKLHRQHAFKIVHCRSYISALVGMGMKKRYNTRFLFDMRGFWADERVDGNIWDLNNPIFKRVYSFFKKKEIQFFSTADYVISLTYNGKEEIESWPEFQNKPPKIEVIPCCVDLDLFNPTKIQEEKKEELRLKLGISKSDFILGYVGSIGTWYMLSEMLDYFKVLNKTNPTAKFLFVTGENPETILSKAIEKGIQASSVHVTSCRHAAVPLNISLFNLSVFFIRPTYSKKASSPTKQGEIMAMGIPLICNAGVGDTDLVVKKYDSGSVFNELSEENYLKNCEVPTSFSKEKTMEGAREFYALETGVDRYLKVYNVLCK